MRRFRSSRPVLPIVALLALVLSGGCSSFEVTADQASTSDTIVRRTEIALWWGIGDRILTATCKEGDQMVGLKRVTIRTNWFYSLCAVVTLGAVVPLDVEYRCTSSCVSIDDDMGPILEPVQ